MSSFSAELVMTDGQKVIVSPRDYDVLSKHSWRPSPSKKRIYASTSIKKDKWRKVYMHRLIMQPKGGQQVDHINGNPLDNRRENLRLCDGYKNAHNRGRNDGKQYKGVRKSGEGWRMTISKSFLTAEEAALAYNETAKILFGEFACLNEVAND